MTRVCDGPSSVPERCNDKGTVYFHFEVVSTTKYRIQLESGLLGDTVNLRHKNDESEGTE